MLGFALLWSTWLVIAGVFLSHRAAIGRWVSVAFFGLTAVTVSAQLVAVVRARRLRVHQADGAHSPKRPPTASQAYPHEGPP